MGAVEAQRTVVKSLPEVWAQLSEPAQLGPMLEDPFGEIQITRVTPESSVEWQGELASGVVELCSAGFGTRVRLIAHLPDPQPVAPPAPPAAANRPPRWRRWLTRRPPAVLIEPAPAPLPEAPAPALEPDQLRLALDAVLDEVGTPRHRPFSRDRRATPRIA